MLAAALIVLLTLTISLLLAPLAYAVIGLLVDLGNFIVPAPDLIGGAMRQIDHLLNPDVKPAAAGMLGLPLLLALAALPGVVLLAFAWRTLSRLADANRHEVVRAQLGLRPMHGGDLEEIQLGNLIEEMALAGGMPAPKLMLIDSAACNLAILGSGADATIAVTRGLLDSLNREQTQALVGQAIAALGNGDGALAERMLRLIEISGLLMLLSQAPVNASARAALAPLLPWRRADDGIATLRHALGDPWSFDMPANGGDNKLTWRDWLRMPLTGSLMIGIIIVPVTTLTLLAPLLGIIWRRRRLLADATAVQFTRNPQGLAEAYAALANAPTTLGIKAPWLVNLFALDVMGGTSSLRVASPYPTLRQRIERLNALGAQVTPPPAAAVNVLLWVLLSPLLFALVLLLGMLVYLGTFVSIALNMLFLGLPVGALHLLLRHLAGG